MKYCCFYNSGAIFNRRVNLLDQLGSSRTIKVGRQLSIIVSIENVKKTALYVTTFKVSAFVKTVFSYLGIPNSSDNYYVHNGDFVPFANSDIIPFNGFDERILYITKKNSLGVSTVHNGGKYSVSVLSRKNHSLTPIHCNANITIEKIVSTYCTVNLVVFSLNHSLFCMMRIIKNINLL